MANYKFRSMINKYEIIGFVIHWVGVKLLTNPDYCKKLIFAHNGDKLTVFPDDATVRWEPANPGEFATSRLSLRMHQWVAKGILEPVK